MSNHRVPLHLCVVTALLCATPIAAQQSVAGGFPSATFSAALGLPGTTNIDYSPLDTGDVNGDGLPDLVAFDCVSLGSPPCSISLFLGTRSGDLSPAVLFPVPAVLFLTFVQPFLVDVDTDGDLDIVGVYKLNGVTHVFLGHGDGQFDAPIVSGGGLSPGGMPPIVVGDVDGDGFPDLVYGQPILDAQDFVEWSRGNGDGTFAPAQALVTGRAPCAVLLADLNADGVADVAFMDEQTGVGAFVVVHMGLGGGAFAPGVGYAVGQDKEGRLVAADADGDGDLDLYNYTADLPSRVNGGVRILHGAGDGTFVFDLFVPLPNLTSKSLRVADLDRDGVPDLIGYGGALKLQRMGPDGPIGPVTELALPGDPNLQPETAVDDLDADGHPDLVVTMKSQPVRLLNALEPIVDLGYGQSSAFGPPILSMSGTPAAGQLITGGLQLGAALPGLLFIGLSPGLAHFHGGVLVPDADLLLPVVGGQAFQAAWPASIPPATAIYVQAVLATGGGQTANSNAVVIIAE